MFPLWKSFCILCIGPTLGATATYYVTHHFQIYGPLDLVLVFFGLPFGALMAFWLLDGMSRLAALIARIRGRRGSP